jgi:hypothetical protein
MAYVDLTLQQFQERFGTQQACLDAIFEARWPRGFICPYCQHNDGNRLLSRPRIVECCSCRRQTSITANTLFHRSHVSLELWFLVIYFFAQDKGGASASRLSKQLGINPPTAWYMLQRLRIAMGTRDENLTLAGYIELDEAFFGGRFRNGGKRKPPSTNKKQVLVMVESEGHQAGNLVMKVISSDQYADLKPIIAEKVESDPPGQWFRSDGWGSHHVVIEFDHRIKAEHVPRHMQDQVLRCVNLAVSHAKRFFKGTYHHFCKTHLQRYLDEFCYRWNRRHLYGQLPLHLLTACVLHSHVSTVSLKRTQAVA